MKIVAFTFVEWDRGESLLIWMQKCCADKTSRVSAAVRKIDIVRESTRDETENEDE